MSSKELSLNSNQMQKVPYSNFVGGIIYSMVSTRPDIAYGVGLVNMLMSNGFSDT